MRKILFLLAFAACDAPQTDVEFQKDDDVGKADSSNQATVLTFEFDAELLTDSSWNSNQTIQDQLLYTIGHLNGSRAVLWKGWVQPFTGLSTGCGLADEVPARSGRTINRLRPNRMGTCVLLRCK